MSKQYGIDKYANPVGSGPAPRFTWDEVRDGWGKLPTGNMLKMRRIVYQARYLNQLRKVVADYYGVSRKQVYINVNSWYRSYFYNLRIGGVLNSRHYAGDATDITIVVKLKTGKIVKLNPNWVHKLAKKIPAFASGGIGVYNSFTHVDHRGRTGDGTLAFWDNRS